jgi:hypothetical protein
MISGVAAGLLRSACVIIKRIAPDFNYLARVVIRCSCLGALGCLAQHVG